MLATTALADLKRLRQAFRTATQATTQPKRHPEQTRSGTEYLGVEPQRCGDGMFPEGATAAASTELSWNGAMGGMLDAVAPGRQVPRLGTLG
jgi:hypothetical protein